MRRIHFLTTLLLLWALLSLSASAQSPQQDEPWLDALTAQLQDHFLPDGQLVLEWARPRPAEAALPAELALVGLPSALAPQMVLRARVTSGTGTTDHSLVVRAQLWRDGWAVREPSNRGESVDLLGLDPLRFDSLRDREAVAGIQDMDLVYSRTVPAGRLLTWRDVARRPLVRRGQMIEVAATEGTLTVTLRAIALADAGRGELVRVRNPDSRREFSAQVVADGRALVRF